MSNHENRVSIIKSSEGPILKIDRLTKLRYLRSNMLEFIVYSMIVSLGLFFFLIYFFGSDPLFKLNLGINWVWGDKIIDYLIAIPFDIVLCTILFFIIYTIKEKDVNILLYGDRKFRVWRNKENDFVFDGKLDPKLVIYYSIDNTPEILKRKGVQYVDIKVADFEKGNKQHPNHAYAGTKNYYVIQLLLYKNDLEQVLAFRKEHKIRHKEP